MFSFGGHHNLDQGCTSREQVGKAAHTSQNSTINSLVHPLRECLLPSSTVFSERVPLWWESAEAQQQIFLPLLLLHPVFVREKWPRECLGVSVMGFFVLPTNALS